MLAPADVPSGLACGCTCVGCGAFLIAKKGSINRWHFAHHSVEPSESCAESAIHAAAKQILIQHKVMRLPGKELVVSGRDASGRTLDESAVLSMECRVEFDRVSAEVWMDGVRPDAIGYIGERKLLVEMYFRHRVDDIKRAKLRHIGLPAIEVDLSDLDVSAGFEAVRKRVIDDTASKSWLVSRNEEHTRQRLSALLTAKIQRADIAYRTRQAAAAKEQADQERKYEETRARQRTVNQRYRQIPSTDKERDLRNRLGVTGPWPHHLDFENQFGSPIAEKASIWQAGLFHRFIYRRAKGTAKVRQTDATEWVFERFNTGNSSIAAVRKEVERYLRFLGKCGFIRRVRRSSYEHQDYHVIHGGLDLPVRFEMPDTSQAVLPPRRPPPTPQPAPRLRPGPVQWVWRASWPPLGTVADNAELLLAGAPHGDILMELIRSLAPSRRPVHPLDCATALAQTGAKSEDVMELLLELELVIKHQ